MVPHTMSFSMGLIHLPKLLVKVIIDNCITCPDKAPIFTSISFLSYVTFVTFVSNIIDMCHWSPNVSQDISYN
jgi:hypothetical protein